MSDDKMDCEGGKVRPLTKEDASGYAGVTLNEEGRAEEKEEPQYTYVHFHTIEVTELPWWKKALFIVVATVVMSVIIAVLWFFFLGGALFLVGAGILYVFLRLMKKLMS